jgi:transcriptional regulator with XRE-family HTH domain
MTSLLRRGHFLGSKLRALRKRNNLTLDELSARCVQLDPGSAPSVSYLSMVETGKRIPSPAMLDLLAGVFGRDPRWFLDQNTDAEPATAEPARSAASGARAPGASMPLEPAFLFSKDLLQNALPELLAQTGTSGRQFARLLVRVWQENHQNDFPDIERAAEAAGGRRMPLSLEDVLEIARDSGLTVRWFDDDRPQSPRRLLRARFEAPATILINRKLKSQPERLRYTLAFFIGHRILHNGDGVIPPHSAAGVGADDLTPDAIPGMGAQDVLLAWRDFECSAFAGALLCPRQPFRQFLARESHDVRACAKLGVTPAVMMRRMTAVSPYRHWHFFDGYAPGYLRAVYRGNGIPLPWGNMSRLPDPCPRWAVFRLLQEPAAEPGDAPRPTSQISVMHDGHSPRLYCCHSLLTRDAADTMHVLSVGIDLAPALEAQAFDAKALIGEVEAACRRGGGSALVPAAAAERIRTVAHVLNIAWIGEALASPASIICPRSRTCPRQQPCTPQRLA